MLKTIFGGLLFCCIFAFEDSFNESARYVGQGSCLNPYFCISFKTLSLNVTLWK